MQAARMIKVGPRRGPEGLIVGHEGVDKLGIRLDLLRCKTLGGIISARENPVQDLYER